MEPQLPRRSLRSYVLGERGGHSATSNPASMCPVVVRSSAYVAALLVGMTGCFGDLCGTDIRDESVSPDGKRKVVNYVFGCGATTANTYIVSVLEVAEELGDAPRAAVFAAEGSSDVRAVWEGADSLVVRYDTTGTRGEALQVSGIGGVSVVFEHVPFHPYGRSRGDPARAESPER